MTDEKVISLYDFYRGENNKTPFYKKIRGIVKDGVFTATKNYSFRFPMRDKDGRIKGYEVFPAGYFVGKTWGIGNSSGYKRKKGMTEFAYGQKLAPLFQIT